MKQVLQNLRSGQTAVEEVPSPGFGGGSVLIQTRASLISAGTERMLVEFGKAGLIAKARSQPDKVKQVLDKIKTDGLMPTLEAVFNRLDEPLPLGYCNAGVVLEVGAGVTEFRPGDRVVSNGPHAEIVCVPKNLCAKIPDGISDEQAAFTVLSSIGLQGIRLLNPTLGEKFVVYGLGLIGLVTVQLLRANGCEVLGVDVNAGRLNLAEGFGAKVVNAAAGGDPVAAVEAWTEGKGVDGVLITAAAKTDEIVHNAAEMCRKRGRIVLVGVVGLNLRRGDFYKKELSFQVSCSYGPGRYDDKYEQAGQDYPFGFIRWTEQRNFQAVLEAMRAGRLLVDNLITHHFGIADAPKAYEQISGDGNTLGVILDYPAEVERAVSITITEVAAPAAGQVVVGVIGAGNFSKMALMPALAKTGARIAYIADLNGAAAQHLARKFGAEKAVTDYKLILEDPSVNAVLIPVRHNLHARFVIETLQAGKHAFVEKPLAMNVGELKEILEQVEKTPDKHVTVGFNRRFSPHIVKMTELLAERSEPLAMSMTVNAGYSPPDSWVHDPQIGGGRIIGEGCHFIDLLSYIAGSGVRSVASHQMGSGT
ncbi:MAG: bi-domain-containing oxidoreductase, partial [Phycisphaerae bacterium]|nr:bi-domain-containing oxidoreductase [Phycisphaerae bacterium]